MTLPLFTICLACFVFPFSRARTVLSLRIVSTALGGSVPKAIKVFLLSKTDIFEAFVTRIHYAQCGRTSSFPRSDNSPLVYIWLSRLSVVIKELPDALIITVDSVPTEIVISLGTGMTTSLASSWSGSIIKNACASSSGRVLHENIATDRAYRDSIYLPKGKMLRKPPVINFILRSTSSVKISILSNQVWVYESPIWTVDVITPTTSIECFTNFRSFCFIDIWTSVLHSGF